MDMDMDMDMDMRYNAQLCVCGVYGHTCLPGRCYGRSCMDMFVL